MLKCTLLQFLILKLEKPSEVVQKHCNRHFLKLSNHQDFTLTKSASVPMGPDNLLSTVFTEET